MLVAGLQQDLVPGPDQEATGDFGGCVSSPLPRSPGPAR